MTIALPHEHDPNLSRRPSDASPPRDTDKEGGGKASPKGPEHGPRKSFIEARSPSPMAASPQDDKARRLSADAPALSPRPQLVSGVRAGPSPVTSPSPSAPASAPAPAAVPPKPEDPTVDAAVAGLPVTADLAHHVLIKVKEDAASTLQQPPEGGAVRRMVDTIKDGVAKALHQTPTNPGQKPAAAPTSARRPSLKLDLSPRAQESAAPLPLQSPAPFVSQPAAAPIISPRDEITPRPNLTPRQDAAPAATPRQDPQPQGDKEEEEEEKGVTLAQVLESMAQDGDDDEEAFFLGVRPQAPAFIKAQGTRPGRPPLGQGSSSHHSEPAHTATEVRHYVQRF